MSSKRKVGILFLTSLTFGAWTGAYAQEAICASPDENVVNIAPTCANGECTCPVGFILVESDEPLAIQPTNDQPEGLGLSAASNG